MPWTIFTVTLSNQYMVTHSHNYLYRSPLDANPGPDIFATDNDEEFSESGTPAPTIPPRDILRFTTEHIPRSPAAGFVFGTDQKTCDVLLHVDRSSGISGKQFAITFTDTGVVILRNLSRRGATIKENGGYTKLETQRYIDDSSTVSLNIADLVINIEKPWVASDFGPEYDRFLTKVCSAAPDISQMRLQSSSTSTLRAGWAPWYILGQEIGRGATGVVHKATSIHDGQVFAIKTFNSKIGIPFNPWHEASMFHTLRHVGFPSNICAVLTTTLFKEHIIQFYEFSVRGDNGPELIMEYAAAGSLLTQSSLCTFNDHEGREIIKQTLQGLEYLHTRRFIHRDLKPGNILLATRDPIHVKLADFGLTVNATDVCNTICGTPMYAAPEVWNPPYTEKIDIWSVGIIVMQLWLGLPTITGNLQDFGYSSWEQKVLGYKNGVKWPLGDFLDCLLQADPARRKTAHICSTHPFLRRARFVRKSRTRTLAALHLMPQAESLAMPDTAIYNPAPLAHRQDPTTSHQAMVPHTAASIPDDLIFYQGDGGENDIPSWNPVNPDVWVPAGARLSSSPGQHVLTAPSQPAHILREQGRQSFDWLYCGQTKIGHNLTARTVNIAHIFKAAGLNWSKFFSQKNPVPSHITTCALRKVPKRFQGTYLPYSDAIWICQNYDLQAGFLVDLYRKLDPYSGMELAGQLVDGAGWQETMEVSRS